MTVDEWDASRAASIPKYAAELERARGLTSEAALSDATQTFPDTLSAATREPRTWVLRVLTADGAEAGWLWLAPHPHRTDGVFVYDVEIDEQHRGQGLGRATMLAAEQLARDDGADFIGLNVFGWNIRAEELYRSLGYRTESTQLGKPLREQS
jgi:ribosomal protein S18 acetylase RimI-like enzyme